MTSDIERLLIEFPNKDWNWEAVSLNPNLTFEFVKKHIDKPWNWEDISQNYLLYDINKTLWYHNNRKIQTIEHVNNFKDEMLGVAWDPSRFKYWCLTKNEQEELNIRWD